MTDLQERSHLEVLEGLVPLAGKRVIEIGCGDGSLARALARRGAAVVASDYAEKQVRRGRDGDEEKAVHWLVTGGQALPFADASADVVVYFNTLHHIPRAVIDEALAEAARVLVPGGLLYVAEPVAEGVYFELARVVEDETEVRALAYNRLSRAFEGGAFEPLTETGYLARLRFPDSSAFFNRMVAVDPARRPRLEQLWPDLERRFLEAGKREPEGWAFHQPIRINLARRPAAA